MSLPEGLEHLGAGPVESFPAAMQIGGELVAQGNMLGAQLIETARLAFMDGMVASAAVAGVIAFTNAVLVKMYMPKRVIHSEKE